MSDSERDFWPEPVDECKACGDKVAVTRLTRTGICPTCFWEMFDESEERDVDV